MGRAYGKIAAAVALLAIANAGGAVTRGANEARPGVSQPTQDVQSPVSKPEGWLIFAGAIVVGLMVLRRFGAEDFTDN